jgi:hypothetical protein
MTIKKGELYAILCSGRLEIILLAYGALQLRVSALFFSGLEQNCITQQGF